MLAAFVFLNRILSLLRYLKVRKKTWSNVSRNLFLGLLLRFLKLANKAERRKIPTTKKCPTNHFGLVGHFLSSLSN